MATDKTTKLYTKNLNMGKNYFHEKWDCYIDRKVKISSFTTRYNDVKGGQIGVWQYKDVEGRMCAILLDREEKPRLFHIFEYSFI